MQPIAGSQAVCGSTQEKANTKQRQKSAHRMQSVSHEIASPVADVLGYPGCERQLAFVPIRTA